MFYSNFKEPIPEVASLFFVLNEIDINEQQGAQYEKSLEFSGTQSCSVCAHDVLIGASNNKIPTSVEEPIYESPTTPSEELVKSYSEYYSFNSNEVITYVNDDLYGLGLGTINEDILYIPEKTTSPLPQLSLEKLENFTKIYPTPIKIQTLINKTSDFLKNVPKDSLYKDTVPPKNVFKNCEISEQVQATHDCNMNISETHLMQGTNESPNTCGNQNSISKCNGSKDVPRKISLSIKVGDKPCEKQSEPDLQMSTNIFQKSNCIITSGSDSNKPEKSCNFNRDVVKEETVKPSENDEMLKALTSKPVNKKTKSKKMYEYSSMLICESDASPKSLPRLKIIRRKCKVYAESSVSSKNPRSI